MYPSVQTHRSSLRAIFFFFNDTATTEIYTLSLHDALPISTRRRRRGAPRERGRQSRARRPNGTGRARSRRSPASTRARTRVPGDRKSTRLNSSHANISYAVFCLKKKKKNDHSLKGIVSTPD